MNYEKKVSICMMVKNEEKNLHRCLSSLTPIIESGLAELIIIDTGSEDSSVKICKKYTDKVYEHPWNNNFSDMRNMSISYAKGEWIWIMDADEEIENPNEMIRLFKESLDSYNTIIIKMKNYIFNTQDEEKVNYNVSMLFRGFRNGKDFRYQGKIHEQPDIKEPFFVSDIIVGHYGYIWEDKEFTKRKFERTAGMLSEELVKDPKNIYYQFQLGVTWATIDIKEGLVQLRKAYSLIKELPFNKRKIYLYVLGVYGKIAYANKKYTEIIEICRNGLGISRDYIDLWYFLSLAYVAINDEENALNSFTEFIKCKDRFGTTDISKNPAFTFYCEDENSEMSALYNISKIYIDKKEYINALTYIERMKPSKLKSKLIVKIGLENDNTSMLINYFDEVKDIEGIKCDFVDLFENECLERGKKTSWAKEIVNYYNKRQLSSDEYYLLNYIRIKLAEKSPSSQEINQKLMELNIDNIKDYYGDVIAYIVIHNLDFKILNRICRNGNLDKLIISMLKDYANIIDLTMNYLNNNMISKKIDDLSSWIDIARGLLLSDKLDDKAFVGVFNEYLSIGYDYITNIYNKIIFEQDMEYHVGNNEHKMFIYLSRALKVKEKNKKEYIQCLRKSLVYNEMKRGIELLLKDISITEQDSNSGNVETEFDKYKKIVKSNINILINAKRIAEAKLLIDEYLEIVPNDLEMLMLKSEIQLKLM